MSESFELDAPDHFTAGAIGPPGERVFYFQARQGGALVTLKCEKEHVRALGRYFGSTLSKLGGEGDRPLTLPSPQRGEGERVPAPQRGGGEREGEKEGELIDFAEPAWTVAAIGAGWDKERDRFMVEMKELLEEEEAEEEQEPAAELEPATARLWITRAQAAAFVERAEALMKAGRPICPMCSQPKDPAGHICPRANGYHATRHVAP
jgi:uncharacterized repeat protein (TIGR03847 family)